MAVIALPWGTIYFGTVISQYILKLIDHLPISSNLLNWFGLVKMENTYLGWKQFKPELYLYSFV